MCADGNPGPRQYRHGGGQDAWHKRKRSRKDFVHDSNSHQSPIQDTRGKSIPPRLPYFFPTPSCWEPIVDKNLLFLPSFTDSILRGTILVFAEQKKTARLPGGVVVSAG